MPGVIALAVVTLLAVVVSTAGLQHRSPRSLSGPNVATLISEDMQTRSGAHQPPDVRCPASEPVRRGTRFACRLRAPHGEQRVDVTETDDQGSLSWRVAAPTG